MQVIFRESKLIKLMKGVLLYAHDQPNDMVYFILCGKIILHHDQLGALGVLTMEQTVGEET